MEPSTAARLLPSGRTEEFAKKITQDAANLR
jgi:hypothetical protein